MKKLVIVLLLVALALGGCTASNSEGKNKSTTKNPEAATAEGKELSLSDIRGTWDADTYTSSFAGLTFSLPSDWSAFSDEELSANTGMALEIFADGAITLDQLTVSTLYDMMAMNYSTGDNVIIMFENLKVSGALDYTVTRFIDELKTQLEATGLYSSFGETYSGTIGAKSYTVLSVELSDYNMNQTYYIRREGNIMIAVLLTSVGTDASSILACFS